MKTKTILSKPLTYIMLAIIVTCFSCGSIHKSNLIVAPDSGNSSEDDWSQFFVGSSAGYGSTSVEGESASSFCVGAEIMYNLFDSNEGALYGGLYGSYHSTSSDNVDESHFKGGVRGRYFDHIIPSKRLQAVYGVDAFAITGKREFSMSEDDLSGIGASAVVGLNLDFPKSNFSLGLEAPVFNYWNQTFKFDGGEQDVSTTSFGINKNNIVMAYLRFGL
ncbi:hypothetical protein [Psychroserpens sp.]